MNLPATTTPPAADAFALVERQAGILAKCRGMVPDQFAGKPNEIIAAGMYGQALGLDLIIALQSVSVINGKPSLDAAGWSALIRKAGHSIQCPEHTNKTCTLVGKRADNGDTYTSTFTWDDAKAARLDSKDTWKKHPKDMLFARALTGLGRRLFSDIAVGGMYTPDELGHDAGPEVVTATIARPDTPASPDSPADEVFDLTAELGTAQSSFAALPPATASKIAVYVDGKTGVDITDPDGWADLDDFWLNKISELAERAAASTDKGGESVPPADLPPDLDDDNERPF